MIWEKKCINCDFFGHFKLGIPVFFGGGKGYYYHTERAERNTVLTLQRRCGPAQAEGRCCSGTCYRPLE